MDTKYELNVLTGQLELVPNIELTKQVLVYTSDTITLDWKIALNAELTLNGGNTAKINFNAPLDDHHMTLVIKQDISGSRVVSAWDTNIKWAGGAAPTLTTTGNAIDILSFYYDGTNYYGACTKGFA